MKKNKEKNLVKKVLEGAFIATSAAGYGLLSVPEVEAQQDHRYRKWDHRYGCFDTGGTCLPAFCCVC